MSNNFEGYKWIKVKKYTMDESKSWEERYKELEAHHIEECNFLIDKVRELAAKLDSNVTSARYAMLKSEFAKNEDGALECGLGHLPNNDDAIDKVMDELIEMDEPKHPAD